MPIKFDIVKAEEQSALTQRVLGKIVLGAPKPTIERALGLLLESLKEGTAKANDVLRIAGSEEIELPGPWKKRQLDLLLADAELLARQQHSAAVSREASVRKRQLRQEQEQRDAAERAEFERWKRLRDPRSGNPVSPDDYDSN